MVRLSNSEELRDGINKLIEEDNEKTNKNKEDTKEKSS